MNWQEKSIYIFMFIILFFSTQYKYASHHRIYKKSRCIDASTFTIPFDYHDKKVIENCFNNTLINQLPQELIHIIFGYYYSSFLNIYNQCLQHHHRYILYDMKDINNDQVSFDEKSYRDSNFFIRFARIENTFYLTYTNTSSSTPHNITIPLINTPHTPEPNHKKAFYNHHFFLYFNHEDHTIYLTHKNENLSLHELPKPIPVVQLSNIIAHMLKIFHTKMELKFDDEYFFIDLNIKKPKNEYHNCLLITRIEEQNYDTHKPHIKFSKKTLCVQSNNHNKVHIIRYFIMHQMAILIHQNHPSTYYISIIDPVHHDVYTMQFPIFISSNLIRIFPHSDKNIIYILEETLENPINVYIIGIEGWGGQNGRFIQYFSIAVEQKLETSTIQNEQPFLKIPLKSKEIDTNTSFIFARAKEKDTSNEKRPFIYSVYNKNCSKDFFHITTIITQ